MEKSYTLETGVIVGFIAATFGPGTLGWAWPWLCLGTVICWVGPFLTDTSTPSPRRDKFSK